jgi:hypothetical protein
MRVMISLPRFVFGASAMHWTTEFMSITDQERI